MLCLLVPTCVCFLLNCMIPLDLYRTHLKTIKRNQRFRLPDKQHDIKSHKIKQHLWISWKTKTFDAQSNKDLNLQPLGYQTTPGPWRTTSEPCPDHVCFFKETGPDHEEPHPSHVRTMCFCSKKPARTMTNHIRAMSGPCVFQRKSRVVTFLSYV